MKEKRKVAINVADHTIHVFTDSSEAKIAEIKDLVDNLIDDIVMETKAPLNPRSTILALIKLAEQHVDTLEAYKTLKAQASLVASDTLKTIDEIIQGGK